MGTFLYSGNSVDDAIRNIYLEQYDGRTVPKLNTACFSGLGRVWKPNETMFFGFTYNPGIVDKIVEDFNKFFSSMKVHIIFREPWYKIINCYVPKGYLYPTEELAEKMLKSLKVEKGEIKEIEYVAFYFDFDPEYTEIAKFVLFTYYAEIIREVSLDYFPDFFPGREEFTDPKYNYIDSVIKVSNKILDGYGNLFKQKSSIKELSAMDNVKLMNQMIIEDSTLSYQSTYDDKGLHTSFNYFVKPSILLEAFRAYKKPEG